MNIIQKKFLYAISVDFFQGIRIFAIHLGLSRCTSNHPGVAYVNVCQRLLTPWFVIAVPHTRHTYGIQPAYKDVRGRQTHASGRQRDANWRWHSAEGGKQALTAGARALEAGKPTLEGGRASLGGGRPTEQPRYMAWCGEKYKKGRIAIQNQFHSQHLTEKHHHASKDEK